MAAHLCGAVVLLSLACGASAFSPPPSVAGLRPTAHAFPVMCLPPTHQSADVDRRVALAAGLAVLAVGLPGPARGAPKEKAGKWAQHDGPFEPEELEGFTKTESGLQYKILKEGMENGVKPKAYSKVKAHYAGYLLANGKKFDASYDRGKPFGFTAGAGGVIKGWDEAIVDMAVGERRILIIPPELAYGNRNVGNGLIPAKSTLVFYIELVTLAT